jgi:hypothetical protein
LGVERGIITPQCKKATSLRNVTQGVELERIKAQSIKDSEFLEHLRDY